MVADGKAVHLVLNARHQREHRARRLNGDFAAVLRDGARAVLIVLYHAVYRHIDAHFAQKRTYGAHVSFAAVEQNEVGQSAEALGLIGGAVFFKTAADDLAHAAVVVLSDDSLDFKLAIRAFQRAAVFKHDHTRNVLAARKV